MPNDGRITSYRVFWPYYLGEHAKPATRRWHLAGTGLVFFFLAVAIATQEAWWLAAMPLSGYGFAWMSHVLIEKNRPATFTHPVWSLISDFKMFFLWCGGKLEGEVRKHLHSPQN